MAQCRTGASAFIRNSFSPAVGVLCSREAAAICNKSHLSFVDLLAPFSRLSSEAHIKDVFGVSHPLQDFCVNFRDALVPPPQPTRAQKYLNDAVSSCIPQLPEKTVRVGDYDISYAASAPWFEEFRESFLATIPQSDHEYLKHYTACVYVASSCFADPMNQFAMMTVEQHQQQQQMPPKLPKWFTSDILRFYVLLHDCIDGEDSKAEAIYQSMKAKYGVHSCHLLKINSVKPDMDELSEAGLPDPWSNFIKTFPEEDDFEIRHSQLPNGADAVVQQSFDLRAAERTDHPLSTKDAHVGSKDHSSLHRRVSLRPRRPSISERGCCLSSSDQDRLKIMVHEFIVRALIPWAERLMRSLNEVYQSKKKGGFIKNFFNRGKPAEKTISAYSTESPEMQLRRLADLFFMFQMYEHAYNVYHLLKKDFESDKAWMFCAGTQEMAGLAVFMQGGAAQRQYPTHYLEGAISVYQTCKAQAFMLRAILMSTEVLKEKGLWLSAALLFLKLTGEDLDLRSGILLEQAAHCYINMTPMQLRKYAFYLILAGHRFSKAFQRKHALRCYHRAMQIYENRQWSLAEDHIGITTSRLLYQLNEHVAALRCISDLVRDSSQCQAQQAVFLKEYFDLYQVVKQRVSEHELPDLAVPVVVKNEVAVTVELYEETTHGCVYSDDPSWLELEEACALAGKATPIQIRHPVASSYNKSTRNAEPAKSIINEPQYIRVLLHNPLEVALCLQDVKLDWTFKGEDGSTASSQHKGSDSVVTQQLISNLVMEPKKKLWILLSITPKALGLITVHSLAYSVILDGGPDSKPLIIQGKQVLEVRGKRLNTTLVEKNSVMYAPDMRLTLDILPQMPRVQVAFNLFPDHLKCGEIRRVPVKVTNCSAIGLKQLKFVCNQPRLVQLQSPDHPGEPAAAADITYRPVTPISLPNGALLPGQFVDFDIWVKAEDVPCVQPLNIVLYYECLEEISKTRYRCTRHSFSVTTVEVLRFSAFAYPRSLVLPTDVGMLLATLTAHNCTQVSENVAVEFSLLVLMCISRSWFITPVSDSYAVKVNQSETALFTVCLERTKPLSEETQHGISCIDLTQSQVSEVPAAVLQGFITRRFWPPSSSEPVSDAVLRTYAALGLLWKSYSIDGNGSSFESIGLHTVLLDTAPSGTSSTQGLANTSGVISLKSVEASNKKSLSAELMNEGVYFRLHHPSRVCADFTQKRAYAVPVTIIITSNSKEVVQLKICRSSTQTDYAWSGKIDHQVVLEPGSHTEVEVFLTVFRYGVYNLSSLDICCLHPASCQVSCSQQPSLLEVTQASSLVSSDSLD